MAIRFSVTTTLPSGVVTSRRTIRTAHICLHRCSLSTPPRSAQSGHVQLFAVMSTTYPPEAIVCDGTRYLSSTIWRIVAPLFLTMARPRCARKSRSIAPASMIANVYHLDILVKVSSSLDRRYLNAIHSITHGHEEATKGRPQGQRCPHPRHGGAEGNLGEGRRDGGPWPVFVDADRLARCGEKGRRG